MQRIRILALVLWSVFLLTACSSGETPTSEVTLEPTETASSTEIDTLPPTSELTADPTDTPRPREETAPTAVSDPDLRGLTLEFWHTASGDKEHALLSLVNDFNTSNEYGIVVTAFSHGSELHMDVREGIPTGDLPHVAVAFNNQIRSWENYGDVVVDLNDYVYHPNWGLNQVEIDDFYPAIWEQDVVAGERLGLPFYRSATVLFYNQTWAGDLGFESPPTTPEEFEEQACVAAAANNNGTGGWIISADVGTISGWLFAFEGKFTNPDGTGYGLDSPEVESAFSFLKRLQEKGCAWLPGVQYPNEEFATRLGLFVSSSVAGIPFQQRAFGEAGSHDQWTVLPFPGVEGDPVVDVYGSSYALFESTPAEQLASWIFIRWMSQPQNQALWVAASDYLPSRASTLDHLAEYLDGNPHYLAAEVLLPYARFEPAFSSWGVARWAVGDYAEQLFSPQFSSAGIPALLVELDTTLAEIHLNYR